MRQEPQQGLLLLVLLFLWTFGHDLLTASTTISFKQHAREVNVRIWRFLTICTFAALTGCASSGSTKFTDANTAMPRLAADKGRIYFYRGGSIVGVAIQPALKLTIELDEQSWP